MKRIGLFLLVLVSGYAGGQSLLGVTGQPDTSYSVRNEYTKLKKSYPEVATVERQDVGVVEEWDVEYCRVGERILKLDVFRPGPGVTANEVGVIIIHGGGWRSGNRTMHHPLAQRLASLGYVCFTPEYRLSTEALFPAAVLDLKSAVRWVRSHAKQYGVNTNRIVALGHSAGGELAAFLGSTIQTKTFNRDGCLLKTDPGVQAVVDIDGILAFIHPESGEGDDSKRTSAATYWFGYSKAENPEVWKLGSPLTHVDKHAAPILFLNSSVARMHAGRQDYINVLNRYGIYSEVYTFETAPHTFPLFHPWFDPMINKIDGFLNHVFEIQ